MSYVLGIDGGTEGCRAGLYDSRDGREVAFSSSTYRTSFPRPGWAEQDPADWWRALGEAVRGALRVASDAGVPPSAVRAVCCDTTCCTVVSLDAACVPLRPALLWMDMRSEECAAAVARCVGDPALRVNGGGAVSAEWMLPKALWLKQEQAELWQSTAHVCEYQDWIGWQLTGVLAASTCNAAVRWHWAGGVTPPVSLLHALKLDDLAAKWPQVALPPGAPLGSGLTSEAAEHLGLPAGTLVVQGGADAFIGMLGLNVLQPGQVALLTGSSHLHLAVAPAPLHGRGVWGSYAGALPSSAAGHRHVLEGGQTSTGSVLSWFRRTLAPDCSFAQLDAEAANVPPGCDGLLCQEHWQGNRTPHTDASSRGVWAGLTLAHTRGHLYRSIMEGVAFGTRLTLAAMAERGLTPTQLTVAGGAARSPLWLQIHADVTGRAPRFRASRQLAVDSRPHRSAAAHHRVRRRALARLRCAGRGGRRRARKCGGGGGGDGAAQAHRDAQPGCARGL